MSKKWQFVDVLALDPELLCMIPQPACALVLLFPCSDKVSNHTELYLCLSLAYLPLSLFLFTSKGLFDQLLNITPIHTNIIKNISKHTCTYQ